jgi:hypothetical protein
MSLTSFIFWIGFIIYLIIKKEKKLALLMTAGIIAGAILTFPVKYFFERERPYEQIDSRLNLYNLRYFFFQSHFQRCNNRSGYAYFYDPICHAQQFYIPSISLETLFEIRKDFFHLSH